MDRLGEEKTNVAELVITCRKHVGPTHRLTSISKTFSFVQAATLEVFTGVAR